MLPTDIPEDNEFVLAVALMAHPDAEDILTELSAAIKAYTATATTANMQRLFSATDTFKRLGSAAMEGHPKGYGWPTLGRYDTMYQVELASKLFAIPSLQEFFGVLSG